jgi:hypothetical protein
MLGAACSVGKGELVPMIIAVALGSHAVPGMRIRWAWNWWSDLTILHIARPTWFIGRAHLVLLEEGPKLVGELLLLHEEAVGLGLCLAEQAIEEGL